MAVLLKVRPHALDPAPITLAVPRTRPTGVSAGEIAYVWFAETQGGRGFVGCGIVDNVRAVGQDLSVDIVQLRCSARPLGNFQIGRYRNSTATTPESTLAKKIYRYAHNRAVPLTADEATFLDQFLG